MDNQSRIQRIVKAKIYIDTHVSINLTVEQISEQACLSLFHFIRLFKIIYGISPYQYLREKRMDMAKIKIATTDQPIMDICFDCGFDSIGSFSTLFKAKTGMSPRQYRQEKRKSQQALEKTPLSAIPHCLATRFNWVQQ